METAKLRWIIFLYLKQIRYVIKQIKYVPVLKHLICKQAAHTLRHLPRAFCSFRWQSCLFPGPIYLRAIIQNNPTVLTWCHCSYCPKPPRGLTSYLPHTHLCGLPRPLLLTLPPPSRTPTSTNSYHFLVVNFHARQIVTHIQFPFTPSASSGNKTGQGPVIQIPGGVLLNSHFPLPPPHPGGMGGRAYKIWNKFPTHPGCFSPLRPSLRSSGLDEKIRLQLQFTKKNIIGEVIWNAFSKLRFHWKTLVFEAILKVTFNSCFKKLRSPSS